MNTVKKGLILGLLLISGYLYSQDELAVPTPPAMEIPAVTPDTDLAMMPTPTSADEAIPVETPKMAQEMTTTQQAKTTTVSNDVNIGVDHATRQKVATILNTLLSNEYVLYTKTLKFHWNVKGIVFHDFHAAFKEQYEKLFEIVDDVAERARALGAPALGSLQEFQTYTRLKEITSEKLSALDMVKQLLADHESIIRDLRTAISQVDKLGDPVTSNFLQEITTKHEKIAWMLRATAAE